MRRALKGSRVGVVVVAVGALFAGLVSTAQATVATGGPGAPSFFDLARKDCVGTARNGVSKVWFTVAGGVLSDVYWPNVDATNVKTLQYLVTDGHSFTDLQTRDMSYTTIPDSTGMACTVIASNAAHHYRITTTYIADPARDAVLMRVRFDGPRGDQLFARLDPLAGGTGGGGSRNAGGNSAKLVGSGASQVPVAFNTNTTTNAVNRSYAVPTFEALESSDGFSSASVGYAGTASDGLTMLDSNHALTRFDSAPDGHVALTAGIPMARHDRGIELALGFGQNQADALSVAHASVDQSFFRAWARYAREWWRYDAGLRRPSGRLGPNAVRQYYRSVNVVKASEDKTFPGAIAAGLASPWGQTVEADTFVNGQPMYFGSYREVFARDLYEAFAGLLVAGDIATARDATLFLFDRQQQADGSMPRNSLENGKPAPDTGGLQLDETSYPILMAWQSGLAGNAGLYHDHVIPAADFLVAHGPSDGVERWEEQSGFSPSTIAAEIAGLTAASRIASVNHDGAHAALYQAVADQFARKVKDWTVTTSGPYAPRYFLRLSRTGDPNAAVSYNLGNGSIDADQRSIVDAGFQELVRLGILPASDSDVRNSLAVVDKVIRRDTPNGPGFYRYGTDAVGSEDGYGDCFVADSTNCAPDGKPWPTGNVGSGHLWPVLGGERGLYDVAAGDRVGASALLSAMAQMTSGGYLEPEQAWEDPGLSASQFGSDPTTASIGFAPGQPAGSASPLTWAQSQFARLALAVSTGRNLETPDAVRDRYVAHGMPGALPLTISSPASGAIIDTATVDVNGTTTAGARLDAEAEGAAGGTAAITSTTADGSGHWALSLPAGLGTTKITVTSTLGGKTGYAQTSVSNAAIPGTNVFDVSDPSGDDNGPGTYQYPTFGDFVPGEFDLTRLRVNETATDVWIQVTIRKIAPIFGSAFGAELLDLYVRDPSATTTSTAAPGAFHYSIAPTDAWSQRIEVQGFASPIWVGANGSSPGTPQFIVDDPTGTATIVLPRLAFGSVVSGWKFTVALTGQDGGQADQARTFAPTPQTFQFGVCATGNSNPICGANSDTVPKVMDTIPPAGVTQASELDPTHAPNVLQGVTVP